MTSQISNKPSVQPLGKLYYKIEQPRNPEVAGLPDPEQIKENGLQTVAHGINRVSAADIKNEHEMKWHLSDFINKCVRFLSRIPLLNRLPGIYTLHALLKKRRAL